MSMKIVQHLIIIGILNVILAGCAAEPPKTKVYFQKKSPMNYFELRGNNTAFLHQEKVNIFGTYESDSSLVTLIFFGGRAIRFEIKADTLLDEDGNAWLYWNKGESGWAYEKSDGVKRSKAIAEAQQIKDAMMNDLNNLAANCYQYRIRPISMGGGGGSFLGYQIPAKLAINDNASYSCIISPDTIQYTALSLVNRNNGIKVQVDRDGRLGNWKYYGDIK